MAKRSCRAIHPKIYGWFDPSDAFNYVGGQFDRYYRGRLVLMVRTHDTKPVVQGSISPPTEHRFHLTG